MSPRTLRGTTAIVGIGETTYYRHGKSPHRRCAYSSTGALLALWRGACPRLRRRAPSCWQPICNERSSINACNSSAAMLATTEVARCIW